MTSFRPCIDLHQGKVKQIVGGTLNDDNSKIKENFVSEKPASWYADLFRHDQLQGGHVIQLGAGNEQAAKEALQAWPKGLQLGGGIQLHNAQEWLDAGASHVIVTSALFNQQGDFQQDVLEAFKRLIGAEQLIIDLSCRKTTAGWTVAMNRWQQLTNLQLSYEILDQLAPYCAEFLVHAADVEGLCNGIDAELVRFLGHWGKIPITYAGGASSMEDIELVNHLSSGKVDLTIGSALDIFGGSGVSYQDLVNRQKAI